MELHTHGAATLDLAAADDRRRYLPLLAEKQRRTLLLCLLISTCEAFNETMPWAFLPFFVEHLGAHPQNVGYNLGTMVAAFFLAQLLSGYFLWKRLPARIGKRPCILIGLVKASIWQALSTLSFCRRA